MASINLQIDSDRLMQAIGGFAKSAVEARQVARRLGDVLPARMRELKREHGGGGARAERLALTDARYLGYLDELTTVHAQAREARIQYETHMMLFEARRSLRPFAAARRLPPRESSRGGGAKAER